MAGEELFTRNQLIFRILEKESFGRQSTNVDEGSVPKLSDRFDVQRKEIKSKRQIAEFKFPINFQGETFYYQQYSKIDLQCIMLQTESAKILTILEYKNLAASKDLPDLYNSKGKYKMTFDDFYKYVK